MTAIKSIFKLLKSNLSKKLFLAACALTLQAITDCAYSSDALSTNPSNSSHSNIVRLGFLDFEQEASYLGRLDNVQDSLVEYLRRQAPDLQFQVQRFTSAELRTAVQNSAVDYFLASSGFFVEMLRAGARDLGTFVSNAFPNPNACVAGVMITRKRNNPLVEISDLQGLRAISTNPLNFMSFVSNLGSIKQAGFNPDRFFPTSYSRMMIRKLFCSLLQRVLPT